MQQPASLILLPLNRWWKSVLLGTALLLAPVLAQAAIMQAPGTDDQVATGGGAARLFGPGDRAIESGAPAAFAVGTDFGNHAAGSAVTRTFTLRNTGGRPVELTGNRMRGGRSFAANMSTALIEPGDSHAFEVTFRPDGRSVHAAELQLFISDGDPLVLNLGGTSFSVDPASGPLAGGNRIRLEGEFPDGARVGAVTVGDSPADFRQGGGFLRRNRNILSITVPAATVPGPVPIVIETQAHGTMTLSAAYEFIPVDVEEKQP